MIAARISYIDTGIPERGAAEVLAPTALVEGGKGRGARMPFSSNGFIVKVRSGNILKYIPVIKVS